MKKTNTIQKEVTKETVAQRLENVLKCSFDEAWNIVSENYSFAIWSMLGKKRITLNNVTNKVVALSL